VAVQRRYFGYHAAVLGPLLVLASCFAIRASFVRRPVAATLAALSIAAGGLAGSPAPAFAEAEMNYRTFVFHQWLPRLSGKLSDGAWAAYFKGPHGYQYAHYESLAALILRRRPSPEDGLHVRGFGTTLYVLTGLRSPSRFTMEGPISDPYLRRYRPEWRREHARALERRPPRFFVATVGDVEDIEARRAAGYGLIASRGNHVLLERGAEAPRLTAEVNELVSNRRVRGTLADGLPFEAEFDAAGAVRASVAGVDDRGSWKIGRDGELCVRWQAWSNGTPRCAFVHRSPEGGFSAFERSGRQLAEDVTSEPL
jgi:hypothetical protein